MVLSCGEIIITPDHYILIENKIEVLKIHRNFPRALLKFEECIITYINQSDESMNQTKCWKKDDHVPIKTQDE